VNIFISADIEGMGGIVGWDQADNQGRDYGTARKWMTDQVNAAIEGALEAGATSVVVKDAHETATNILLDRLNPGAELISGWGPLGSMVEGVDDRFDAVFLLGYHARAMSLGGTLAHTWSGNVLDLQLNGQSIGEAAWAAAFAGHYNVPLALVTGDDKLKLQIEQELPPGSYYVITKTGMAHKAARLRPLKEVCEEIRDTAAASLSDVEGLPVFKPDMPATVSLRFRHWEGLDICAAVPHVRRLDVNVFEFTAADMIEAQKYFATLHRLAPRQ
jgi:D-amino peptidase